MITDTTNSVNMIAYLRILRNNMVRGYKTKWAWLVLDNHKSHHTDEVLEELKRQKFKPLFLPSTSSWYSSVEYVWNTFKMYFRKIIAENRLNNTFLNDEGHLEPMIS